jgi:N-acetylneuraminic acid mutarotase
MIAVMTLGSQMVIYKFPRSLMFPGEMDIPRVQEIPVDILGAPGTSVISGGQGDIDGGGMDPRNPRNTSLLAPAMGGGTWTQKADMPTARFIPGSAVVDGKIYVIGGAPDVVSLITAAVEEYDPAADTWTRRADMPTARQGLRAAAVDGMIYAFGGWDGDDDSSTVEAYDPATDTWIAKADMPNERSSPAAAVVDGIIYVIGGQSGPAHNVVVSSVVEAYDPATDEWTRKADMPTARCLFAACVIDGRIYASGGATEWGEWPCVSTVEVYDPATDTWTQAPDMPMARRDHSASAVDGKMYIIGGANSEIIELVEAGEMTLDEALELILIVDVYDPATDTWTTAASIPAHRNLHTAAVVDGKIYAIGGQRGPEGTILSMVEEFAPGLPDNISVTNPAGKLLTTWGKVRAASP